MDNSTFNNSKIFNPNQLSMKRIMSLFFAGLFFVACNSNTKEAEGPKNTDLISQNLKGKVQRLEETPYKVDSTGKIGEMDSCCVTITEFDEKGYSPKYTTKDNKGKIKEESTLIRYEGGQMKDFVTMADGKKKSSFTIQIDKDGKYIGGQSFDSSGKMDSYFTDLKENEYGAVTNGKAYKTDSTLKYTFTNNYDKAIYMGGHTDSAGKMINETRVKVNDKGDMTEMNSTNVTKDSTINKKETFTYESYDDNGNWTQRTAYDEKGKATKILKRVITYYKKD
jgi:hypothetical protein